MRKRRQYHSTPLLAPMIDLFVLNLVLLILNRPVFGSDECMLPMLQVVKPALEAGTETGTRKEAFLRVNGDVEWNNERTPIESLAKRIARETSSDQLVAIVVELDAKGQGATRNLLQFQMDASRLNIGARLRILHRPENAAHPTSTAEKGTP